MSRFPIVYDEATTPARGPRPGAVIFRDWALATYPLLGNLGIYVVRSVVGGSSLSTHAEGRGIDLGTPSEAAPTKAARDSARQLLSRLLAAERWADLGIQCLIFDRRIWTNERADEGWRAYHGSNAHRGHIHVELTREAAEALTIDHIYETIGGATVLTQEDRIRALQTDMVKAGMATAWWIDNDGHAQPIVNADDPDQVARYADGALGENTLADLLAILGLAQAKDRPVPKETEALAGLGRLFLAATEQAHILTPSTTGEQT